MGLNGKQIHDVIARRKDRERMVKAEAQIGSHPDVAGSAVRVPGALFDHSVPDNEGLSGGFAVCARRCGHTRAFHKPENAGRRNSRGIVYDGHKWEDRERS